MRKLVLIAVFAAAALFGAGCDGSSEGGDSAKPAASTTSAGSTGAADNTKQVCTDAKALGEEYKKKVVEILARAVQKTDEAEIEKVLNEVVPLSKEYKTKFEALAKTANNQQLKDALTVLAKDMDNASAETASEAAGAAEETLTGICGA
jgi:basic membrane lipoprotein Med (substrate-binding protein (PBP1-ABC) superfamily)